MKFCLIIGTSDFSFKSGFIGAFSKQNDRNNLIVEGSRTKLGLNEETIAAAFFVSQAPEAAYSTKILLNLVEDIAKF